MEYLTVAKTADLKGCSERYIKKLCKDGKLSCNIEINDRNRPKYHHSPKACRQNTMLRKERKRA